MARVTRISHALTFDYSSYLAKDVQARKKILNRKRRCFLNTAVRKGILGKATISRNLTYMCAYRSSVRWMCKVVQLRLFIILKTGNRTNAISGLGYINHGLFKTLECH